MKNFFYWEKKKSQKKIVQKEQNTQESNEKVKSSEKPIPIYFPPIIIDNVTFSTTNTNSEKDMQKNLVQIYDRDYLKYFGYERLCIEIVREQDFLKICRTIQKNYICNNSNKKSWKRANLGTTQLKKKIDNQILLKHFWGIDFCKLKVMNLSKHNLLSIEGLTFMELPNLVCLELHSNKITIIDCLSRISLPKLQILTLYNNKISSSNKLYQSKFPQLSHMEFDYEDQHYNPKIQNIYFIFKMQQKQLKKLYLHDDNRIMSRKIYIKLDQFFKRAQHLKTNLNKFIWKRGNFDNGFGRRMIVD